MNKLLFRNYLASLADGLTWLNKEEVLGLVFRINFVFLHRYENDERHANI